jgi:alginate O-acetyltransferase complex protein AlgJ
LLPPNAQSIPTRDLPSWWHVGGPLEYDLAMHELRHRGIATVDLKAAFSAMPDAADLYRRTDSHWRWKAALVAFNLTMQAIGHDEWSLDPATSLSPLAPKEAGDLANLLGLQGDLTDADYVLRIVPAANAWTAIDVLRAPPYLGSFHPYALERTSDGVRILVLGDSFTRDFWQPMLEHSGASRIGWMHLARCAFDFADVVRFQPTHVIITPAERLLPCALQNWPRGLPREGAMASR